MTGPAEVVRSVFAAWGREGDLDAAFDPGFHPQVEYREDPDWPGAATYRGLERVKGCFTDYAEVMQFDDSTVETVVDAGDEVVAVLRASVRPAAASEPVVHRWGYLCRVRDGRVAFFQAYRDPSNAFAAAGIDEPAS